MISGPEVDPIELWLPQTTARQAMSLFYSGPHACGAWGGLTGVVSSGGDDPVEDAVNATPALAGHVRAFLHLTVKKMQATGQKVARPDPKRPGSCRGRGL